ncbi:hypothetical protein UFOVP645_16 [uncultured Caudovirales phage]|uniref:Uncharacterized protein n=1 Tax=uncultured Caudovirales phage TaxID=2100421 RepID=A0A6J5N693_9CAUD|nr:hypothetical protein UFOVP645_16 [uncultured Caudovirales phage]
MIYATLGEALAAMDLGGTQGLICPLPLTDNSLNIANHLVAIQEHGLGPADPREPNTDFWAAKAVIWGVTEGDARGHLCCNCNHYWDTTQVRECIANGPAMELKASNLPLTPKWADIESHPVGYCDLYDITCSPIRTCDSQELGGPVDDERQACRGLPNLPEEA